MTQLQAAKNGIITEQMKAAASAEGIDAEEIRRGIADGTIVLPANINHKGLKPMAVGKGLSTKINANIGTSEAFNDLAVELSKLDTAIDAGAHSIMDLSTGGSIDDIRRTILDHCPVMLGTVPIYQTAVETLRTGKTIVDMEADDIFDVIEKQAQDGVDFMTVHCGVTMESIEHLRKEGRLTDIVSRGGSFITGWMLHNGKQNPLYEQFDKLLDIALRYDVTLSLGDGLRPGCLADATDRAQISELVILGELAQRAYEAGVQVMIEGPGHMPLDQITANIQLEKHLCHGAPFYVLGPLVTDIAPGYDHITAAIGGAIAAAAGADFLCYVTPAEHLGLPSADDVREGVIASLIAAHAADIAKGVKGAMQRDISMAKARKSLNWQAQIELSIDPEKANRYRREKNTDDEEACTMCGRFCAMKLVSEYLV
ncbi:phosphomethylpyrimidine synthase ThiC [Mahella sp.]|uniref:phosphomethylpyrimidine synthase ThiC n=1 Tax=Mahella sp. TaxID=2798721 RepID=UPI0025C0923E|nr:phosphomethylpyrimidine synthase ThiC [Mahella sp.]MBZ4666120.1 hydroxymethylpyrimidine synthase [Mahella sp.]